MAFIFSEGYVIKPNPQLAKVLGNSHATRGSGLALINLVILYCSRPLPALAGRGLMRTLCCSVCAMKGSSLGTLFYATCWRMFNP